MRTVRSYTIVVVLALAVGAGAHDARALVWPDVPARIERALASTDAQARRAGAQELATLGVGRATPLVLKALGDPDADVRLAAAQAAIRLRLLAATDAVMPWLGERDPRLRAAACEVARDLPSPRAVTTVARALGDADVTVRTAAAEALGAAGSVGVTTDAVTPLLGKLDDASPAVRVQIARSLARLGDGRAVVPLVGKVQDSAPEVRQAVARALGELGDPHASPALVLQLRDSVADVRIDALAALGRLRALEAVGAIVPLASDRVPALRQAALTALGRIGTREAVRALVASLGVHDDANAELDRSIVRDALVLAGATSATELRGDLAGSPSRAVALGAASVLGALKAKDASPVIVAAMRRGALPPAAALRALAGTGDTGAVTVVLELLANPSPAVRLEARRAAAALLDPSRPDGRAVEPIAAALRTPGFAAEERASLALLLGRTGAPRAAILVAALADAKERPVRLAAIDALGLLGAETADEVLLHALADDDAQVRLRAAVALASAGGTRAEEALVRRLDDDAEVDRPAVLTALAGIVARHVAPRTIEGVVRALDVAAGAERDALIEILGRAVGPSPSAPKAPGMETLAALARGTDAEDRRTVATVLGAGAAAPMGSLALALSLLADGDASVRAQAAWALGYLGDAAAAAKLANATATLDVDGVIDATGALARIAARASSPELAARSLCPHVRGAHPYERANALAGLALVGARCGDGASERRALEADPSEIVRAAAALTLSRHPIGKDEGALLERCASGDRSPLVAQRCAERSIERGRVAAKGLLPKAAGALGHPVTVYVVPETTASPQPGAPYALELAHHLLHVGTADRRGAVFEPQAPEGDVLLRKPSAAVGR